MFHSDPRDPIRMDTVSLFVLILAMLVLLSGCPALQVWEDMTPKAKALWLMSTYDREFEDYVRQASEPEKLTEAQKIVMRAKKAALKKAWPLIKLYSTMVTGGVPSANVERQALDAVRDLVSVAVEEVLDG